jgi:glycosyltransferase involved in cell wall biosynthesis
MSGESVGRPKICHLIHEASSHGGGGTLALTYFPAYSGRFDTFVICGRQGDLADKLRQRGLRTLTLGMERIWRMALIWPALVAILRREKPDALIVHGQWGGMFGTLAARTAGVPVILYYAHFPSFWTDWDLGRIIRNRLTESVTCRFATRVVCLSPSSRYQFLMRHLVSEDKVVCIPNAVEPPAPLNEAERSRMRQELDLPDEKEGPTVVSISRLADQKRIDWLLRAWALVEASGTRAQLVVVGGGREEKALHQLARQLQLKRCRFLGPRSEAFRYYQLADLGVICSMFEALSLALIEAMFCGCPMVGTAVDGIADLIDSGRTGLLVAPGDPPALAKAILEMLADPKRAREMAAAARDRAYEHYQFKQVAEQQIALLQDSVAHKSHTG